MKKFIAFIGLFAMVLFCVPCNIANASSSKSVEEYKVMIDNYVDTKRSDRSEYPYYVVQIFTFEGHESCNILYSKYPIAFCTKYLDTAGWDNYYIGSLHPNNSTDRGDSYVHQSEADSFAYQYNGNNQNIENRGTHSKVYIDTSYPSVKGLELYTNHNIYNFETGELVFQKALVMTKLAEILEQSNRQQTPMYQVISLMPLAISLVVSFLSLRKFFKMLQTTLFGA